MAATDGASHSNFLFGGTDKQTGEFFCCYDLTPVGWGARSFADGNDAGHLALSIEGDLGELFHRGGRIGPAQVSELF